MIRYIFIERNGITNTIETAKDIINPLNNYLIKHDGKNHTLITIYNNVIKNFKIEKENIDINFMLSVNYFKKVFCTILKFIIYCILRNNYVVYKRKNEKMIESITTEELYIKLKDNKLNRILYLLKLFENEATKKVFAIYRL